METQEWQSKTLEKKDAIIKYSDISETFDIARKQLRLFNKIYPFAKKEWQKEQAKVSKKKSRDTPWHCEACNKDYKLGYKYIHCKVKTHKDNVRLARKLAKEKENEEKIEN
jgi:hypothetical protein